MPDPNLFRLNHVPYSWTSCGHFFNGFPYKGVTAVDFEEGREVKVVHAGQQDGTPVGITSGLYTVTSLSFTLLRDSAYALLADMTILGLGSYGDAESVYILQHFEPALPVPSLPSQVLISGIRVIGVADKQAVGADELVTEIKCQALYVTRIYAGVPLKLWSVARSLLP